MDRVLERTDELRTFPRIGQRVPLGEDENVRRILFDDV